MFGLSFTRVLTLSRPRFWLYELGTFALGVLMAAEVGVPFPYLLVAVFALYFLFPANLLIYGVNDVYDYETDRRNPKKAGYEDLLAPALHRVVLRTIVLTTLPFVLVALFLPTDALQVFLTFLFFAVFYSVPPIRAKARPMLDTLFSAGHYVATGVFGYFLVAGGSEVLLPVIAGMLWAMAMHAYSAVPDIKADSEAGLSTIATLLGAPRTIVVCALAYLGSGLITYLFVGALALALTVPYLVIMGLSLWVYKREDALMRLYTYFPYLNALTGMALFFIVLAQKGWL